MATLRGNDISHLLEGAGSRPAGSPAQTPDPGARLPGGQDISELLTRQTSSRTFIPEPTVLQEVGRGFMAGIDQSQAGLYGVALAIGQATGSEALIEMGLEGAESNLFHAGIMTQFTPHSLGDAREGGTRDIFEFLASGLGQGIASMGFVIGGAGLAGIVARRAGIAIVRRQVKRLAVEEWGIAGGNLSRKEMRGSINAMLSLPSMQNMLVNISRSSTLGGLYATTSSLEGGHIALELADQGFTAPGAALLGGLAAGALDALPAARLIRRVFPGVNTQLAKSFVRDIAQGLGTQALLEGSTEAAQEAIAVAALAYHDPSFNPFTGDVKDRLISAAAIGALVGAVTGGSAASMGRLRRYAIDSIKDYDATPSQTVQDYVNRMTEPLRAARTQGMSDSEFAEDMADIAAAAERGTRNTVDDLVDRANGTTNTIVNSRVDREAEEIVKRELSGALNSFHKQTAEILNKIQTFFNSGDPEFAKLNEVVNKAEQALIARTDNETRILVGRVRARLAELARRTRNMTAEEADQEFQAELASIEKDVVRYVSERQRFAAEAMAVELGAAIDGVDRIDDDGALAGLQEELNEDDEASSAEDDAIVGLEARGRPPAKLILGAIISKIFKVGGGKVSRPQDVRSSQQTAVGFEDKADAERAAVDIRKEYPTVNPNHITTFQDEEGVWFVGIEDVGSANEIFAQKRFNEALIEARALAHNKNAKTNKRVINIVHADGTKTLIDVPTLALGARDADERTGDTPKRSPESRVRDALAALDSAMARLGDMYIFPENFSQLTVENAFLFANSDLTVAQARRQVQFKAGTESQTRATEEGDVGLDDRPTDTIGENDFPDPQTTDQNPRTDEAEARESANRRGARARTGKPAPSPSNVDTFMPGLGDAVARRLRILAHRLAKIAGISDQKILIVNDEGMIRLASGFTIADKPKISAALKALVTEQVSVVRDPESGAVTDASFPGLENNYGMILHDNANKTRIIWIRDRSMNFKTGSRVANAKMVARILMHEMGHLVQRVHFDRLPLAVQNNMLLAWFDAGTPNKDFDEWMADQFAAWSLRDDQSQKALKEFWRPTIEMHVPREQQGVFLDSFFSRANSALHSMFDAITRALDPADLEYSEFLRGIQGATVRGAAEGRWGDAVLRNFRGLGQASRKSDFIMPRSGSSNLDIPTPKLARGVWAKVRQRMDESYPRQMEFAANATRAMARLNDQYFASLHSVLRRMKFPAATELVNMFHKLRGDKFKGPVYSAAVQQKRGEFFTKMNDILKGTTVEEQDAAVAELIRLNGRPGEHTNPIAIRIRALMDDAAAYAQEAGLPLRTIPNYYSKIWDSQKVRAGMDEIITLLKERGVSDEHIEKILGHMASHDDSEAINQMNVKDDDGALLFGAPSASWLRSRGKWLSDPAFDKFLSDDLRYTMTKYLNSVVKRSEYHSRLGDGKLEAIFERAKEQGATREEIEFMGKAVEAMLGRYGAHTNPKARRVMAWIMTYQNVRLLGFSQLASLPDIVGPAIRTGEFGNAWRILREQLNGIASSKSDLADAARIYGIISDTMNDHILTEHYDTHWMPEGARRLNEKFFRYTGMEKLNNFVRQYALAVGFDFINQQALKAAKGDTKAIQALDELGLTHEDVSAWIAGGQQVFGGIGYDMSTQSRAADEKVAHSMIQFVNEANMRPSPSQRPLASSHPALMLIYHLKSFMYAFYDVFLRGMWQNIAKADTPAMKIYMAAMPGLLLLVITALGLELRELVQYRLFGEEPRTDRMDGMEYMSELIQRSGMLGVSQIAVDWEEADERGQTGLAAVSGPTISQMNDVLNDPFSTWGPKAVPVFSQIAPMRDWLRGDF